MHLENARRWVNHCGACHLPGCDTDKCPGHCYDCGSSTSKLRWVPGCAKTEAVWRPEMALASGGAPYVMRRLWCAASTVRTASRL
jgi:hypothetical protein